MESGSELFNTAGPVRDTLSPVRDSIVPELVLPVGQPKKEV